MDRIRNLYLALTKPEVRYLKVSLKAFHSKGENRALQLIEHLEKCPDLDNAEMAERLYGDPKSKAFIMLKSRLADRMMETMTLNVTLQNNQVVKDTPNMVALVTMHKMLCYALLLRSRGLHGQARDLLEKTLEQAQTHGNTALEVQCLSHLCNLSTSLEEVQEVYRPGMTAALESYGTDLVGIGLMAEYRLMGRGDRLITNESIVDFLAAQTQHLEQRLAKHYALRGHLYLLILRSMLHQMRNEFEVCRELIHDRLDLFQAHPGLCNKNRMGAVYMQLANIETNCLRFEEAIQAAEQARDSFPPSKPSYLKASTILIFATLYQGQLDWARAIIDELQSYQGQPNAQRIMPVVSHLEACWQYMKGDLRAAHLLLAEDRVLVQDKSGWNVGQRILEIMILVELGDLDVAEARVETLRKHIARHGANPRDELIFRVLYQASRCVFDFTQLGDKFNCAMEELAKHDWVSMNHEVIRFETWIRCQQEGRPYLELMPTELAAIRMRS